MRHCRPSRLCTALIIASGWVTPALAQHTAAERPDTPSLVSLGVGYVGVFDAEGAGEIRMEYRWGRPLAWKFRPWVGLEPICEGALYVGAGLLADFGVGERFVITPGLGAGLYGESQCLDLGNAVEFRTQVEVGYRFDSGQRLSVAISHLSNAGLSESNPGTEIVNVYYHVPVHQLFGPREAH